MLNSRVSLSVRREMLLSSLPGSEIRISKGINSINEGLLAPSVLA